MSKVNFFEQHNAHGAAIDIGSRKIFVSDGINAHSYATFTEGYRQCIADLKSHGVRRVCMAVHKVKPIAITDHQ